MWQHEPQYRLRPEETAARKNDGNNAWDDAARANGARESGEVAGANALRRDDREPVPQAVHRHHECKEERQRSGEAGNFYRSERTDRKGVDESEQLVAEHLNCKRNRKAPECGAYI